MTRVTIVSAFATVGGSEQWILGVLDHAGDALEPRFVVLQDGEFVVQIRDRGIPVDVLPTGAKPWQVLGAARPIRRLLAEHPTDVVVGNGVKAQTACALAARSLGLPTVWVKHDHSFDKVLARPLGRAATSVVSTALEVGLPTGRDDLVVIEPPRPPEPLPADEAAAVLADHGFSGHRPTVAMITRLVPYKGVDVAVEALTHAPEWNLLVVGGPDASTPDEGDRLRGLARQRGLTNRVEFAGSVPAAGRLLSAVDALAVLTRPDPGRNTPAKEGFGIVATEAMLAGIPVVVAGYGPIAGRLATAAGPAGIVVPQSDPVATGEALDRLADPEVRRSLGAAGRAAAREHPDEQQVADRFVAVLREAATA